MSTHARPLAVWLAAAPDAQLAALLRARGVRAEVDWLDFFDAAEALLDAASIDRILTQLTLPEATALRRAVDGHDAGDQTEALLALALLRDDGTPPPPVAEAVSARPEPQQSPQTIRPALSSADAQAHAAERAFTSVAALADVLLLAREAPLALLTNGNLAAGEKRRMAEAGMPSETADDLIAIAGVAGLVTTDARQVRLTAEGESWLVLAASERWAQLAESFRVALPRGLRTPSGGWLPVPTWPHQHPWDSSWNDRSTQLRRRAHLLGLIADDGSEPAWVLPLRDGESADATALQAMLPDEVDRIFLQNDLSAIAPGPLVPALDVRLRGIATRESAAQASSYRFTVESISRAIAAGETTSSILEFLDALSLTGIPQPLEYLVTQTAQRHGLVRVFTDDDTGRTRVVSSDATMLDALGVDQALRPIGLTRDAEGLSSRVSRDTVYWALTDARYPTTIVGSDGLPQIVERNPAPPRADATPETYAALITRLRAQQGPDADAAWLDRELEAAVRAKALLLIEIMMPDGSIREMQLEANGLGGGRLRGRDRAADVERTLPVKSIRSARVVAADTAS
ncbi:helicase-associated domain-containing protein [Microbacterium sp. A94]|uniref:helicase-associated domain-containing protein n=1 Tax=Microbacterium sp. A94 TaxID=3450717 RepID=UPI003F4215E5